MSVKAQRLQNIKSTRLIRRLVQGAFFLFILGNALVHNLGPEESAPSLHAYCPFGGVETLFRLVTEGQYVQKIHASSLVLLVAILVGVIFAGGAFCGWICPFGTLNDMMGWLRKKLGVKPVTIPVNLDRWLRYGRYLVLILILYMTASTVKLWFADLDPYATIFGLEWLFEFDLAAHWLGYLVSILILVASFFIPRAWCRYACPMGAIISFTNRFSFLRIRRNESGCKACGLCNKECSVGIDVAEATPDVGPDCIGCLECVGACPHPALDVKLVLPLLPATEEN